MDFHLAFTPKQFPVKIQHRQSLLLAGSCFTENIGSKLKQLRFKVLENPHGILFNPISIVQSVNSYISHTRYTATDLFYENECWNSWDHHSRFSHPDRDTCLAMINQSQQQAHDFIKTADWIMLTVGSAFVYALKNGLQGADGRVVANCHKVPTDKFYKKLLAPGDIVEAFSQLLARLFQLNPGVQVIFTISPVRHLRDGFVENNRSKAALVQAVHQLVDADERLHYFPAYELVIDDLRDYRFYAEDMVHPNYAATNYVWEKFTDAVIDPASQQIMKEISAINTARNHKAFNPGSASHKKFLQQFFDRTGQLQQQYPYLDLSEELLFFKGQ